MFIGNCGRLKKYKVINLSEIKIIVKFNYI